jgi:hypothetical protein
MPPEAEAGRRLIASKETRPADQDERLARAIRQVMRTTVDTVGPGKTTCRNARISSARF